MEEIEFNDIPEELAREYEMDKKNEEGLDMYQEFFINNLQSFQVMDGKINR